MSKQTITIDCGRDHDFTYTLRATNGAVYTQFTVSDVPSCIVWGGGKQPASITPATSWIDPTQGTILIQFLATDTAALDAGKYNGRVTITRVDGRQISPNDFWVQLIASPGTATAPKTYVVLSDLINYASWVTDLQSDTDLAGLTNHCGLAREWLDGHIQNVCDFQNFIDPAIPGWSGGMMATRIGRSKYLQTLLDAGALMLTPEVKETCCKRALGTYCRSKISAVTGGDSNYSKLGRSFLRQADEHIKTLKAYLDVNNDGYWEYAFETGKVSVRTY